MCDLYFFYIIIQQLRRLFDVSLSQFMNYLSTFRTVVINSYGKSLPNHPVPAVLYVMLLHFIQSKVHIVTFLIFAKFLLSSRRQLR